jgi:hypothetical protein
VVLAGAGLQHGGLDDVHPLRRRECAAEEFLELRDLRTRLGIYLSGPFAPQRKQLLGDAENLCLTVLITLRECDS